MENLITLKPDNETKLERRDKIQVLINAMSKQEGAVFGDSNLCPLKHTFADGQYIREITIPKDVAIVGKIHRHRHGNFILKGRVIVYTEQEGQQEYIAPCYFVNEPGTQRAVYALEDTVWVTVHNVTSADLKEIEKEVIVESFEKYEKEKKALLERSSICHGDM